MTQWGLDNLFNPGKRHMDDEKRRLQSTREEIGDNSGGRRIDLEGGRVSISVRRGVGTVVDDDVADLDDADVDRTDLDDTALDPALEAEEMPAVALANDEAEIVPALVDEPAPLDVAESADVAEPEPAAVLEPESDLPVVIEAEPAAEVVPEPVEVVAEPAPVVAVEPPAAEPRPAPPTAPAAKPRSAQSARAWARRG